MDFEQSFCHFSHFFCLEHDFFQQVHGFFLNLIFTGVKGKCKNKLISVPFFLSFTVFKNFTVMKNIKLGILVFKCHFEKLSVKKKKIHLKIQKICLKTCFLDPFLTRISLSISESPTKDQIIE